MPRSSYSRRPVDEAGPIYGAILIAVIIAIGFIITQSGEARLRQSVQTKSDSVVSPVVSLISKPLHALETLSNSITDRKRAYEENIVLRAELKNLRADYASLLITRHKLSRYEEILSAETKADTPLNKVIARAVSDIEGPFVRALLVNAGKKDNVQIGQAVMSDDGLVGHVILTSSNSSRVLRLDDLNSRIPVMSARSQSVAILAGDNRDDPRLLYVDEESDWEEGDIVMTSGDAGRLPRGLNVGRVISAEDGTLRVKITGLQRHLDWVWIAQFKPIALPLDEVVDSPETEIEIETETENVAIPNGEQTSLNGAVLTVNEGATSEPAVLSNE
jgi:rod shape-determining protein MreC